MLIILDRDGVINVESDAYIKAPDEWVPIPGSLKAIARLTRAGHSVVIMTNQSGIGRGFFSVETLNQIHAKLSASLSVLGGHIEKIYYCPHHPNDNCICRKPKPGMLKQIQQDFNVDLKDCLLIGDSWRDMQAAQAAQCPCWLVKTGRGQQYINDGVVPPDFPIFASLSVAVDHLLNSIK